MFRCSLALATLVGIFQVSAQGGVDFSHQIVPLLRKHCAECHTGEKKKGGFSFNDRESLLEGSENGPVIDPQNAAHSVLLDVVTTADEDLRMPPKGERLTDAESELLRQWIAEGTPWQEAFTFAQPAYEPPLRPREVAVPAVIAGFTPADSAHPVDRLFARHLQRHDLRWPERLDDGAFIRRAYLDLIGLLPTPEDVQAFTRDARPDKDARLVQDLLARDIDYTEHWLTFWNDLLRNDYGGTGFITGGRRQISRWLYEALIQNLPYDELARQLIAPATDESRGFIDGIRWRGDVSAGQTVEIQFAQSLGQSFLGINLKCASCHDSFIDRWKLDEAYGLAAIYAEKPLEIHRCDKAVGRQASAAWLFPELGQIDPQAPRDERLKQLAGLMTHPQNGRFTRTLVNRLWHRLMGRGIVHPLDAMQTPPWDADLLDFLATDFQKHGFDIKHTLELIATSQLYRSAAVPLTQEAAQNPNATVAGPRAKRLTAEQFMDAVWQLTGTAPTGMDAPVFRGKVDPKIKLPTLTAEWIWGDSAAAGHAPPAGERLIFVTTLDLPAAVQSGGAILTCDNECQLYLNGRFVISSTNWENILSVPLHNHLQKGSNQIAVIGVNAGKGPNPAGLFFEAHLTLEDGTKQVIRSGADWKQAPRTTAGKEGRLGALPKKLNPVTLVRPVGAWTRVLDQRGPTLLAHGDAAASRPIRASLLKSDFLTRSLGRPNRDQIVSMRPEEITTLEAIDLSNTRELADALQLGSEKLCQSHSDSRELVRWLFLQLLARDPTPAELATALEVLGPQPQPAPTADLLWALLMQPEFLYVR